MGMVVHFEDKWEMTPTRWISSLGVLEYDEFADRKI